MQNNYPIISKLAIELVAVAAIVLFLCLTLKIPAKAQKKKLLKAKIMTLTIKTIKCKNRKLNCNNARLLIFILLFTAYSGAAHALSIGISPEGQISRSAQGRLF